MGRLTVDGLDTLREDLAALAALPDSVIDRILDAEADVIAKAQQEETARQWQGDYATGTTSRSIKKGKARKSGDGRAVTVAPQGTNARGTRNAEVAFINEYGKRGQPARPAIRDANERKGQEAVDAGEKAYHAYLDSKKL